MLSVSEARALISRAVAPLASESVALQDAYNRVLAAPVTATRAQPPFRASAMDGYAFAFTPSPRDLTLAGESAAGCAFPRALAPNEAVRISTGAPLPAEADCVLIQEDARIEHEWLRQAYAPKGQHVRERGIDFRDGDTLLRKGQLLSPIDVALAAAAGRTHLDVSIKPRIAVLATGTEIVSPGATPGPDQIFESASYAVRGLAMVWGANVPLCKQIADDAVAIDCALTEAAEEADAVVFIGGASVGPHDLTRGAAIQLGYQILVSKVAVRPGKPAWFATRGAKAILGLPGNPASAIVCAHLFLRNLLNTLTGCEQDATLRTAILAAPLDANGMRETYLRAQVTPDGQVRAFEAQDSSLLLPFSQANALICRPAGAPALGAGESAPYLAL